MFQKQAPAIALLGLIVSFANGEPLEINLTTVPSGDGISATTSGYDGTTPRQEGTEGEATTHSKDRKGVGTTIMEDDTDLSISEASNHENFTDMTDHLISPTTDSGVDTQTYYNKSRPEPRSESRSYDGIHIVEFDGATNVNLCINTLSPRIHSCKTKCSKRNGDLKSLGCSCDDECYKYNECCPDYEMECLKWQPLSTSKTPATTTFDSLDHLTQNMTLTTDTAPTTTEEPYYVRKHEEIFDRLDFVLTNIPDVVRNRPINKNFTETCTNITIAPDFLYYMVAVCPNSSHEENEMCSKKSESLLPVYSKTDGLFYANRFCAACNNKTDDDFEYVHVTCQWICDVAESPYPRDAPKTLQKCHKISCFSVKLFFNPQPRTCDVMVTNCSVSDDSISRACNSYSAPVYGRNDLGVVEYYKNAHCARCNGITDIYNPSCRPVQDGIFVSANRSPGTPLTVLFDFSGGTLQKSEVDGGFPDPLECEEHFEYHRGFTRCRRVSCPTGSFMNGQKCIPSKDSHHTNRTLFKPSYRKIIIKLGGKEINVTDDQILSKLSQIYGYFKIDYYSINRYEKKNNESEELWLVWNGESWKRSENIAEEEACAADYKFIFEVTLEGETTRSKTVEQGIDTLKNYVTRNPSCNPQSAIDLIVLQLRYSNFPHSRYLCNSSTSIPRAYDETSFTRMENNGIQVIRTEFPENKTINSSIVAQEVVFTGGKPYKNQYNQANGNWSKMEMIFICEEAPSCVLITLLPEEYLWNVAIDGSSTLVVILETERKVVPNNETFLTHDGHVQICLDAVFVYEVPVFYSYSNGQTFATTIGCSISIGLLAIVIATYCTFPSLRNIPGKTVLNLSISLILAQLLLLVGADKTALWKICLIIACAMHFLWLSVFTWTNILAFDLAQTFGKKATIRSDENNGALFFKYSVYGWGIPFIIVTITTLLHYYGDYLGILGNLYDIEYTCWLRGGNPVLLAFGVPVAGALLVNIMFFVRTVHGIRSTTKMMAMFLKKGIHDDNVDLEFMKKELYLYIRLSITIGLTWISGFITPYTGIEELGYLFIILNSLQGPVIFLSFTFSRRVGKLWRNKLGCGDSLGTSSADRSTTVTGTTAGSRTATAQYGHSVTGSVA